MKTKHAKLPSAEHSHALSTAGGICKLSDPRVTIPTRLQSSRTSYCF